MTRAQAGYADRSASAIGVFDSGVGGISVLRALRDELPLEKFVYVADSGHAPYGERDDAHVITRSHAITRYLLVQHRIKALVVACNTATAAAIKLLRQDFPDLLIVGIEPALKPAALSSKTKVIGVLATRGTLNSEKFRSLLASLHGQARFVLQPCDGLADAIEHGDATKMIAICADSTGAMGQFGQEQASMDTLVLGCTHYPFIADTLRNLVGDQVAFLEGGVPVARQTRRLLAQRNWLVQQIADATPDAHVAMPIQFFTTGDTENLQTAVNRWLELKVDVQSITIS